MIPSSRPDSGTIRLVDVADALEIVGLILGLNGAQFELTLGEQYVSETLCGGDLL